MCPRIVLTLLLSIWMLSGKSTLADVFDRPPEIYAPVWQTASPYQRNINVGFSVNPVAAPGSGIPGAVYGGSLDPSLKANDYVTLDGAVQWYNSVPGFTPTGVIGIDNRTGTNDLAGEVVFRLENTTGAYTGEHLWEESDFFGAGGGFSYGGVYGASGTQWTQLGGPDSTNLPNGAVRFDYEFGITPNQPWELVTLQLTAGPGATIFFDNVHIATEAIPEPSAFSLLTAGTAALAGFFLGKRRLPCRVGNPCDSSVRESAEKLSPG